MSDRPPVAPLVSPGPALSPKQLQVAHLVIILGIILLIAAFFRFWQLGSFPPGFYHDEAYNGLDALSLTQGKTFPQFYEGWELYAQDAHAERPPAETRFPLFFEGNYGREPFHIYLMALSVKLFGPTPFAIRAVPALFGVLAVLTTFLAAKALFKLSIHNSPFTLITPLTAAFALAILFPAVHFSRFGLRAMLFVPIETLAVYFFWKAVNLPISQSPISNLPITRSTLYFLLSGFLLGFGLYIYAAARLFPLLFIVFVLYWFWRDRAALRAHWLNVGLMGGTAVLTALPLLIFFWQYPYFFVFRIAYVANKGKGAVEGKPYLTWLLNIPRVLASFFWQGETHLRHNFPGRPYLDPIQIAFFLTGIFSTIRRLFQPRIFFLFLWLAVMLLPTIMSGDAPHFGRMTGVAPVVAIFIGLGVDRVFSFQFSVFSKRPLPTENCPLKTAHWLLITVLLISAAWTGYDYFGRYANHPQIEADFYLPDWQMGQYAAQVPEDAIIYLTPAQEELATIYFALADSERLQNYTGSETLLPLGVPGRESLYLIRPSDPITLSRLPAVFPDGTVGPAADDYTPFHVPANAPRNLAQNRTDHTFAGKIRLAGWTESRAEDTVTFTLFWQAEDEMAQDYTAFIHLVDETGQPVAQIDRPPHGRPTSDWQPGEMIMDSFTIPLPPDLPEGDYAWTTGFYYLPTLERLGEAAEIGD